uniref:Uncharacterized protein n=1 Tax=Aegilops tauschii TaxID=37682 RepID=M8BLD2_AEGTA
MASPLLPIRLLFFIRRRCSPWFQIGAEFAAIEEQGRARPGAPPQRALHWCQAASSPTHVAGDDELLMVYTVPLCHGG